MEEISCIATLVLATATVVLAIAAFGSIRMARKTLCATERQQHFEFSPFLKVDIQLAHALQDQLPEIGRTTRLWDLPELKAWADSEPAQPNCFVSVLLENTQRHPMGIAASVKFRAVLTFPEFGTPNSLESPKDFTDFFLEPGEKFELTIADLKGIPHATIDISSIEYYDIYKNRYTQAYGYTRIDVLGQQQVVGSFKAFS